MAPPGPDVQAILRGLRGGDGISRPEIVTYLPTAAGVYTLGWGGWGQRGRNVEQPHRKRRHPLRGHAGARHRTWLWWW